MIYECFNGTEHFAYSLNKALKKINYKQHIESYKQKQNKNSSDKGDAASNESFENIKLYLSDLLEKEDLNSYLQELMLASSLDVEPEAEEAVSLMTMHNSKGLEYKVVFIVGCGEDLLPHKMTIKDFGEEVGEEEERRLFFVAMTRAKKHLFISYCSSRPKLKKFDIPPSRFLFETDLISE
jgi:DNA helicase-2/ATP-dependent DNA helicase PcrA